MIVHIGDENVAGNRISVRGFVNIHLNIGVDLKYAILNTEFRVDFRCFVAMSGK